MLICVRWEDNCVYSLGMTSLRIIDDFRDYVINLSFFIKRTHVKAWKWLTDFPGIWYGL